MTELEYWLLQIDGKQMADDHNNRQFDKAVKESPQQPQQPKKKRKKK